ncbi:MAG: MFS transporter [Acidimicrobiia bacterium]
MTQPSARASKLPQWLTHNLKALSGVSFLQDAASELLYPILPIFLTVTLGAPVAVVGIIEGAADAAAALSKPIAGRMSDRRRRRPFIAFGYGLAAVGKVVVAAALVWPVVLAGRVLDRIGKGVRGAPRDALLADGSDPTTRGRVFGFHRAADTAGAVVGPLLGLAAYEFLDQQIRPVLWFAAIPAVLSTALVFAVRETRRTEESDAAPHATNDPPHHTPLPQRFWRVALVLIAFGVVNFPDALLLLRVKELGYELPGIVLVYVTYNLSYTVLSYPAGAISDRLSPPLVVGTGLVCFAVAYFGLGVITSVGWVWVLFLVYGGFTALTDGVGKAWISKLVGPDQQGEAQGVFQGGSGLAVFVAGLWAGLAWDGTGRLPLIISGSVAAVLALGLLTAGWRQHRSGIRTNTPSGE